MYIGMREENITQNNNEKQNTFKKNVKMNEN
jgi:hypothetical protein